MGAELTIEKPVDEAMAAEISSLPDDLYRNRWITWAYFNLSCQIADLTDSSGIANWCTFARWASYSVGENLELESPTRMLRDFFAHYYWWLKPFHGPLARAMVWYRTRNDRAFPTTLGIANRLVFSEMGRVLTQFIRWSEKFDCWDEQQWQDYAATIAPDPASDAFPASDAGQLRRGLEYYHRARCTKDRDAKVEMIYAGNVLLVAYEQWRLRVLVQLALDPVAKDLVKLRQGHHGTHPDNLAFAKMRRTGRGWAYRHSSDTLQWLVGQSSALATKYLMTLEAPIQCENPWSLSLGLGLGRGFGVHGRKPLPFSKELATLDDPEIDALYHHFDLSGGVAGGSRADNWGSFPDRMNVLVNLFRMEHSDKHLHQEPRDDADMDLYQCTGLHLDLRDEHLNTLRHKGDETLDPAVAKFATAQWSDARTFLRHLVNKGPSEIDHLYGGSTELPAWASRDLMKQGQEFFGKYGIEIALALFGGALPETYTGAHGAQVLITTTEMISNPRRRVAETGQMLVDIMKIEEHPLSPGTRGYQAARGVRLFHAAVRHMLLTDPRVHWDVDELGIPINQEDLLGALTGFSVTVISSLRALGVDFSHKERDAYIHLWLVVGALMGIDYSEIVTGRKPNEQPLTYYDLEMVQTTIARRQTAPSPGGQQLTAALLNMERQSLPSFLQGVLRGLPRDQMRALIGDPMADMLSVPPSGPLRLLLEAGRPVTTFLTKYTNRSNAPMEMLTRRLYKHWIDSSLPRRGHDAAEPRGERPPWRFPKRFGGDDEDGDLEPAGAPG